MRKAIWKLLTILCLIPWKPAQAQTAPNEGLVRALAPEWRPQAEIGGGSRVSKLEMAARLLAPQGPPMHAGGQDIRIDVLLLFREGENADGWTGMIAIQDYIDAGSLSPEEAWSKLKEKREKICPGTMQWKPISRDETSLLYRWHSAACGTEPEEDDIGRVIVGRNSWYALDYAEKTHTISPDTLAKWTRTFSDATFDSVTRSFNAEWISVDVDEVVPFAKDKVIAALNLAMTSQDCKISVATEERIECKRRRIATTSRHEGSGGESVTAELEAKGEQTQVRIRTGKGFYGRLVKKNWSTPVFEAMMSKLQATQP